MEYFVSYLSDKGKRTTDPDQTQADCRVSIGFLTPDEKKAFEELTEIQSRNEFVLHSWSEIQSSWPETPSQRLAEHVKHDRLLQAYQDEFNRQDYFDGPIPPTDYAEFMQKCVQTANEIGLTYYRLQQEQLNQRRQSQKQLSSSSATESVNMPLPVAETDPPMVSEEPQAKPLKPKGRPQTKRSKWVIKQHLNGESDKDIFKKWNEMPFSKRRGIDPARYKKGESADGSPEEHANADMFKSLSNVSSIINRHKKSSTKNN